MLDGLRWLMDFMGLDLCCAVLVVQWFWLWLDGGCELSGVWAGLSLIYEWG